MAEASNLSAKFQAKTRSLASHAARVADGLINIGQVVWETLDDKGPDGPGFDRFFWTARDEFVRQDLSAQYIGAYSKPTKDSGSIPSKVGEIWLAREQYDWLMQTERDFLMRRHSRIRVEAHSAAIKRTFGDTQGPIYRGIIRHIDQIMKIAASEET